MNNSDVEKAAENYISENIGRLSTMQIGALECFKAGAAFGYRLATGEPGPAGFDRRWKCAAEDAFGRKFETPREMMEAIRSLLSDEREEE